ncbi:hypothetical protein BGZ60DRAFT_185183 [Tricladium varicosporioides]|nr:hypothetical protein BGZ60DRAFT_185183 [Hymenoscyphus varicosporioides]
MFHYKQQQQVYYIEKIQNPTNAFPKQPPSEWDFRGVYPIAKYIPVDWQQNTRHVNIFISESPYDSSLLHHDRRPLQQKPFEWQLPVPFPLRKNDVPLFLQLHKHGENTQPEPLMKLTRGSGIGILPPPSRYYDLGEEAVWATYTEYPCRHLFRVQTQAGDPMGDPFLLFRRREFGAAISWMSLIELKNACYSIGRQEEERPDTYLSIASSPGSTPVGCAARPGT